MDRDKRMQCLVKQIAKETGCTEQSAKCYMRIVLEERIDIYLSTLFENNYMQIYYGCLSEHYLIKGDLQKSTEYLYKSTIIDKEVNKNDK